MSHGFDPRPISKAAKNERRKLTATSLNTIGLTLVGLGVLTPIITGVTPVPLTVGVFGAMSVVLHLLARRPLKSLED